MSIQNLFNEEEKTKKGKVDYGIDEKNGNVNNKKFQICDFEKDNPRNFHIDFVHTSSNLKASCYSIKTVDIFESKVISGKISKKKKKFFFNFFFF